ncbi:hypothetical protein BDV33DRAFT_189260 [Aspergillus novoparasiticus]|uniref:Transcription factor domain-containing protein n=1 Tax=Aspergillus novoparasiticus TaxID=986946 RepID=A0A5N6F0F5_9EURO|nr:hypothetical protein BDV33DRAFT_189260 [Aspergillus novoparasiticus]
MPCANPSPEYFCRTVNICCGEWVHQLGDEIKPNPNSKSVSNPVRLYGSNEDIKPKTTEYLKRRREYAHCFAQTALGVIEKDYELLSMSQNSQTGLADTTRAFERAPFHPKLEVPLEGVVTLSMLSIYEYAQRGNIDDMLQRANQALALAMSMALHEAVEEEQYADSKRRVWWMTSPVFDLYDPWFVTPYPEGWKLVVEAQQVLVESAVFASDLDRTMQEADDASWVSKPMESDNIANRIGHGSNCTDYVSIPTDTNSRMDMPLEMSSDPRSVEDLSLMSQIHELQMPFTSEESSKICLHAALNIVTLLDNLLYPNHTSDILANTQYARGGCGSELPRTMPTVVCCGVQSSYALLMLSLKARVIQHTTPDDINVLDTTSLSDFRNELYHNLRLIVKFLENYSIAFEAIQGISDKLNQAIDREFLADFCMFNGQVVHFFVLTSSNVLPHTDSGYHTNGLTRIPHCLQRARDFTSGDVEAILKHKGSGKTTNTRFSRYQ